MAKQLYIETVGCQMNVLDSELVAESLLGAGYELVDSPRHADAILFNTCSVRQHAEDKIYSALGRLKQPRIATPGKSSACSAAWPKKTSEQIFKRAPHVDLVVGPGQLSQLPALLEQVAAGHGPQLEVSLDRTEGRPPGDRGELRPLRSPARPGGPSGTASRDGADHVRLRQVLHLLHRARRPRDRSRAVHPRRSRPKCGNWPTRAAWKSRCWARRSTATSEHVGRQDRAPRRPAPAAARRSQGIRRLQFVTNYPRHMTHDLLQAVRDLPKVSRSTCTCPPRAASNAVLKRMKRGYTVEQYRECSAGSAQTMPHAAVTSDFIVGFCGETEDDFRADGRPGPRGAVQEQLHLQVQPAPGDQGRRNCTPTTCPRRSSGGGTTICWPCRTRSAWRTTAVARPQAGNPGGRAEQVEAAKRGCGWSRRCSSPAARPATGSWSSTARES